jgi:hypothetical protein
MSSSSRSAKPAWAASSGSARVISPPPHPFGATYQSCAVAGWAPLGCSHDSDYARLAARPQLVFQRQRSWTSQRRQRGPGLAWKMRWRRSATDDSTVCSLAVMAAVGDVDGLTVGALEVVDLGGLDRQAFAPSWLSHRDSLRQAQPGRSVSTARGEAHSRPRAARTSA